LIDLRNIKCFLFACLLILVGCSKENTYYTWQGIGPDKWASIWMIHRDLDPKAPIRLIPVNESLDDSTAFDIPNASFYRNSESSTIDQLKQHYNMDVSSETEQVIQIIHDIEVTAWGEPSHPRSEITETAFRDMQLHFGRDQVSAACYIEFFDNLASALKKDSTSVSQDGFYQSLIVNDGCANQTMPFEESKEEKQLVDELPVDEVLTAMREGKKVVFVDAREAGEFAEFHIPNAINMQLRKVDASVGDQFKDADLVVAYCLKDFRGFELAKALKLKAGVDQAVIMNPFGINGWKAVGLPVTGNKALPAEEANSALNGCVQDPASCGIKSEAKG
jgi:rhodanese-related sulfurtransferase